MKNTKSRMNRILTILKILLIGISLPGNEAKGQQGLKIYISADMEGVVGAVTGDQLGPGGFEYSRFRTFMTNEVNSAIKAAKNAGASEILVSDSHGNGENLLIENLPSDIQLVRSWPRPLGMMQGIDESFDAAIFIGYHSSTTNTRGVRAHTFSSANLTAVRLNGIPMPEAGVNAAIAGHFGVPVVMISGDDAIVEEAQNILGPLEGAIVKESYGFHSAKTIMPEKSYQLIEEKVSTALSHLETFEPYQLELPVNVEVSFKNYLPAELLSYLDQIERIDAHTIRFIGKDLPTVSRFFQFIGHYSPDIGP